MKNIYLIGTKFKIKAFTNAWLVHREVTVQQLDGWKQFGAQTHVPLWMNCNNFGDPLTFHLLAPFWWNFQFVQYFNLWPNTYLTSDKVSMLNVILSIINVLSLWVCSQANISIKLKAKSCVYVQNSLMLINVKDETFMMKED